MKNFKITLDKPDQGYSWIILASCTLFHVLQSAVFTGYANFVLEYIEYFKASKSQASWIGAILLFSNGIMGIPSGSLARKYGCRKLTIFGSLVIVLGYVLSSFANNLYLLFVTHGLICGTGYAMTVVGSTVAVQQCFKKYRGVAVAIATSGIPLGVFLWSPTIRWLLSGYSWQQSLLIIAGIHMNGVVFGALLRKPVYVEEKLEEQSGDKNLCDNDEEHELEGKIMYVRCEEFVKKRESGNMSLEFIEYTENHEREVDVQSHEHTSGLNGSSSSKNERDISKNNSDISRNDSEISRNDSGISKNNSVVSQNDSDISSLSNEKIAFVDSTNSSIDGPLIHDEVYQSPVVEAKPFRLRNHPDLMLYYLGVFMSSCGHLIPYNYTPLRAVGLGLSKADGALMLSVLGIASLSVRWLYGILGDRGNRIIQYGVGNILAGLLSILSVLATGRTSLFVYIGFYGLLSASYVSVQPTILADLVGIENVSMTTGQVLGVIGLALLFSTQGAGYLFDILQDVSLPFVIMGSIHVLGGLVTLTILAYQRKQRKHLNKY